MSDGCHHFEANGSHSLIFLPFQLKEAIQAWYDLRSKMIRQVPGIFTRQEWAYLIQFVSKDSLMAPFLDCFGRVVDKPSSEKVTTIFKPRGPVGIWLPNNVSLLGPLMMVLVSLAGVEIKIKAGSRSRDLTGAFLEYALEHLPEGAFREYIGQRVSVTFFDHSDQANQEMAESVKVRLFFGASAAAKAIEELPHPLGSKGYYFTEKVSQAWLETANLDEQVIETIIRVFAIYGQVGCTSPAKLVLIDGESKQAVRLRDRVAESWPRYISAVHPAAMASENFMLGQWARALGWSVASVAGQAAVIASGGPNLPMPSGRMFLPICYGGGMDEAIKRLPYNIQTIGHALSKETCQAVVRRLGEQDLPVSRFVPLGKMHHFRHIWDGYPFWRGLFIEIEIDY